MSDSTEQRIVDTANAHEGRYLLRRRYGNPPTPSPLDAEYEACDSLVSRGVARWLGANSQFAPGIELTRR